MIRYLYNQQTDPPAPFVHVTIRGPRPGKELSNLPAQLDSAADRSTLPASAVTELGLVLLDEARVQGFGGAEQTVSTFGAELAIRGHPFIRVEVFAHEGEPYVLLGRDVMNRFRIVLDGLGLAVEIE